MPRYPQATLVSCQAPWDENEQLLEDVFRREVRHLLAQGFNHLYIFGTAGEGYAVDTARFRQMLEIFYAETRGDDVRPMVGVIGLSTANVVERLGFAYDVGFRTFQISLPCWGGLNDAELLIYFQDVCGTFPDAQFLHYNLPRTRRVLNGSNYRRLADAVPNLVATKSTGGGAMAAADLMRHAPDLQHFFGEANFASGCLYGECSLLASWGPATPRKAQEFFAAGQQGDIERLYGLEHGFRELLNDFFAALPDQAVIDGAYDKILVRLGGFEEMPLRLLSPYASFSEEAYVRCRDALYARHRNWFNC